MSISYQFLHVALTTGTPVPISATTLNARAAVVLLPASASGTTLTLSRVDTVGDSLELAKGVPLAIGGSGHADTKNSDSFNLADYALTGATGDTAHVMYEAITS